MATDEEKPTDDKPPIEYYRAQPEHYKEINTGTFIDIATGRICRTFGKINPFGITKETSHSMAARKREIVDLAALRTLARKAGVDVETATQEEIFTGALSGMEAWFGHGYDLGMAATSPRQMEGLFSKVLEPFTGDTRSRAPEAPQPAPGVISANVSTLLLLSRELENEIAARVERAQAIEAEVN